MFWHTAHPRRRRFDGLRDHPVPLPHRGAVPPAERKPLESKYDELPWAERRSRLVDALLSAGELDILGFQVKEQR